MKVLVLLCASVFLSDLLLANALKMTPASKALRGQFPFITKVKYSNVVVCTGSIVHPMWVVTAAHCVAPACQMNESAPILNCTTNDVVVVDQDEKEHKTNGIHISPLYAFPFPAHDFAAVKVKEAFVFSSHVRSIPILPLPFKKQPKDCRLVGYGRLNHPPTVGKGEKIQHPEDIFWVKGGTMAYCSLLKRKAIAENKTAAEADTMLMSLSNRQVRCVSDILAEKICLSDNAGMMMCNKELTAMSSTLFDYNPNKLDTHGAHCDSESSFIVMVPMSGENLWLRELIPDLQEAPDILEEDYIQLPKDKEIPAGGEDSEEEDVNVDDEDEDEEEWTTPRTIEGGKPPTTQTIPKPVEENGPRSVLGNDEEHEQPNVRQFKEMDSRNVAAADMHEDPERRSYDPRGSHGRHMKAADPVDSSLSATVSTTSPKKKKKSSATLPTGTRALIAVAMLGALSYLPSCSIH